MKIKPSHPLGSIFLSYISHYSCNNVCENPSPDAISLQLPHASSYFSLPSADNFLQNHTAHFYSSRQHEYHNLLPAFMQSTRSLLPILCNENPSVNNKILPVSPASSSQYLYCLPNPFPYLAISP